MAFIITKSTHAEEIGRMFTGDNVLGHGTAVFEDLAMYLSSLEKMKERIMLESSRKAKGTGTGTEPNDTNPAAAIVAYPAHGAIINDAKSKIEEYISHRKMREDEALNILRFGSVKKKPVDAGASASASAGDEIKEWDSMDMVKVIYKDVPVHLHEPAERGLVMVLEKLKGEGRVMKGTKGWRVCERGVL